MMNKASNRRNNKKVEDDTSIEWWNDLFFSIKLKVNKVNVF